MCTVHILLLCVFASLCDARHKQYNTHSIVDPDKLNIHIVPHSHDDVGWKKTVDQYYWGTNQTIERGGVQYILDTVMLSLKKNPNRKFIEVETAFFARWWEQQDDATKELVKQLHSKGQLLFINGGWSMHDEANPHYTSMIDQTTFGHRWLKETLGAIPEAGWQIDPFGHSGTQAALLTAETGFVGFYFARIDYEAYDYRVNPQQKAMEVVWRGSPSLGAPAETFAGAFYNMRYSPPPGFDWSIVPGKGLHEPIMDDPNLEGYNVQLRVGQFLDWCKKQANSFRTNNIIITMGRDFKYADADHWYNNIDKLIHYINANHKDMNALYSDPVMYTWAKNAANDTWPLKTDDYLPIANEPHAFWSGYFTSRPAFKRMARWSSSYYTYARQVLAQSNGDNTKLYPLIKAIGLAMHHDAITGTEKQHVVFDYQKRLAKGRTMAQAATLPAVKILTGSNQDFSECIFLNISLCPTTSKVGGEFGDNVTVFLYNPSSHMRNEVIQIPVRGPHVIIQDSSTGKIIQAEVVVSQRGTDNYRNIIVLPYTIQFMATELPPQGWKTFDLITTAELDAQQTSTFQKQGQSVSGSTFEIDNGVLKVGFDTTGKMAFIHNLKDDVKVNVKQDWQYYRSSAGDKASRQASGAYIFRPNEQTPFVINDNAQATLYNGNVSQQVDQVWQDWCYQRISLDEGSNLVRIDYTIGPIPKGKEFDRWGKEVISKFSTNIVTNQYYYTDSNGRDIEQRKRNYRKYFQFNNTEPVAGNYFPVNVATYIKDEDAQMTILTDASQGGGSIQDGNIEVMAHRRLLHDDHRGVDEILDETEYITPYYAGIGGLHYGPALRIRGTYWLTVTKPDTASSVWRKQADNAYFSVQPSFAVKSPTSMINTPQHTPLSGNLPTQVQIITVEKLQSSGLLLLRIGHQYGVGEDAVLSQPVTLDLTKIYKVGSGLHILSATEMTLTANRPIQDVKKPFWRVQGETNAEEGKRRKQHEQRKHFEFPMVTLQPMQIRTFLCEAQ